MGLRRLEAGGAVFGVLLGSALHFSYDWSGKNLIVGLVSAVNESPWEHLKLFAFPVLFWLLVEWRMAGGSRRLLYAKAVQIPAGMVFILAFFYTYTGAFGIENVVLDILSFVLAMALGYWLSYHLLAAKRPSPPPAWVSGAILGGVVLMLWAFTFVSPHLPLFLDHVTGRYGI